MKIRLSCDVKNIDSFIAGIRKKYHFNENDVDELLEIYQQIQLVITPYAEYRINRHTTGVELIDRGTAAAVAMSLGAGLDRLQERYMREEKLSEAYMLDCISSELLLVMYKEFNSSYARFHRRYVERYVFIGDAIPVTAMRDVLEFIAVGGVKAKEEKPDGEVDADEPEKKLAYRDAVAANEYGVLTPSKSVVFYAVLSENPASRCRGICLDCGNTDCENRYQEARQLPESINTTHHDNHDYNREKKVVELNYGYQRIFGNKN
jgi:hypothetical protein